LVEVNITALLKLGPPLTVVMSFLGRHRYCFLGRGGGPKDIPTDMCSDVEMNLFRGCKLRGVKRRAREGMFWSWEVEKLSSLLSVIRVSEKTRLKLSERPVEEGWKSVQIMFGSAFFNKGRGRGTDFSQSEVGVKLRGSC